MTHAQAVRVAQEAIAAEIKRLAPLANMAEPPAGIPANPTPAAVNAATRRRQLRAEARSDDALAAQLVGDALVVSPEADLRWLDLCDERLVAQAATETTRRTPR